ncbi:hypothetical protein GCM10023319_37390 [Nocardia iowensis]
MAFGASVTGDTISLLLGPDKPGDGYRRVYRYKCLWSLRRLRSCGFFTLIECADRYVSRPTAGRENPSAEAGHEGGGLRNHAVPGGRRINRADFADVARH